MGRLRKSFKDSLKTLQADIQLANTLASDHPQEYDGGCLQMRLAYSPAAHLLLFLVLWTDCHFAGSLGLLRILIYKAYVDGKTTMFIQERRASIKEFYGIIFPTLLQLHKGISDVEERKQRELCASKYKKLNECDRGKQVEIDSETDEECGICMEICSKIVLPLCLHSMCMKCHRSWRTRSQSCPFCRDSLKRVDSRDLWIYTSRFEIVDQGSIGTENMRTLIMFVGTLPHAVPDTMHVSCGPCYQ